MLGFCGVGVDGDMVLWGWGEGAVYQVSFLQSITQTTLYLMGLARF